MKYLILIFIFFNQNHPDIDVSLLNSLIEKLQNEMLKTPSNDNDEFIRNQIQKTFDYLQQQSQLEKFHGLKINN